MAKLVPTPWQIDASGFVYERDASMVLAGVGAGKTFVYLNTIQDWIEEGITDRVMLVAPLRVCTMVWRQEARKWDRPVTFSLCTGELSPREQREAVEARTDVLLVNNAMAPKVLKHGAHGCDALVIDELSKYRDPTSTWSKAIRGGPFKIRSGGTGTPAPNGYLSLYGMCHAVGLGHLVGRNFDKWKRRYFYPTDFNQYTWAPFPGALEQLAADIKPYVYVLENGSVELPPVRKVRVDLQLPADLKLKYAEMRRTLALSEEAIYAPNNGVARNKLRQIASGFVYDKPGAGMTTGEGARRRVLQLADWRFEALAEIVDEMQGQPLIIAYEFVEQKAMMIERWPMMRFLGGGTSNAEDEETVRLWIEGKLPLLGMHPASAGHGLNDLDLGGSTVAWWQPPDDLELYNQLLGRLTRRGQKAASVTSLVLCAMGTVDEGVFDRLGEKDAEEQALWNALRR